MDFRKHSGYCFWMYLLDVPELVPPVSHSGDQPFYANARVLMPILFSILILVFLVAGLFWRKSEYRCSIAVDLV